MKKQNNSFFLISVLLLIGIISLSSSSYLDNSTSANEDELDLKEIIKKAENRLKGVSSISEMKITIVRPKYTRSMVVKSWTKGDDYSLMYIKTPARDEGTVYLKRRKEIWYYLPSVERNIKMPPSMMSQSWMGTDLSNDDLVKKSSLADDYTSSLVKSETVAGYDCYQIKLIPSDSADVVWGRVDLWIDKTHFNVLKQKQYDEDIELVNTMVSSKVKKMGGKTIASKMEFTPADEPKQKTKIEYLSIEFDVTIPDSYFTTQYMTKVKP